jgi:hypothetical protein
MRKSVILFASLLLVSVTAMAAKEPPTATSVLAANKAASGGAAWGKIHSFRQVGTIRVLGLKGPVKRLSDLETGAYVMHMKLSLGMMARGDDGKTSWTKFMGGATESTDLPVEHARALTKAYLNAKGYWYPQHWPATMKLIGTKSLKNRTYQVVRVTPKGGAPATLWFDARTHLLARQVQQIAVGTSVTTFSDYRTVDGVKISYQAHRSAWDNNVSVHMRTVKINVPTPSKAFAMPAQTFNDVTFAHGAASATIPFKLVAGRLIEIHAAINGHPVQLILDSGASETIPTALAKSLDLKAQGSSKVHGVGKSAVATRWTRVKTLTLGNLVTLHHQVFKVQPLGNVKKLLGPKISGLVGYEIFKRFVVRIDYAHKKLTLIKHGAFDPKDAGTAIPIAFVGTLPAVNGSLDGLKGEFTIDTGMVFPLMMWTPFVMRHDLLSRYNTSKPVATGGGIGGGLSARIANAGHFMFGPIAIKNPPVFLTASRQGALRLKDAAGNIGAGILKRFTVTFDYPHKRLYLKPNAELNRAIALPAEALKKFVGRYQLRPHAFVTISSAGDQLSMQVTGQPALPIYPESKTEFFLKIADVKLDFRINSSDQVTGVVLHQGGHSFAAKRVGSGAVTKSASPQS